MTEREELREAVEGIARAIKAPRGHFYLIDEPPGSALGAVRGAGRLNMASFEVGRKFGTLRPLIGLRFAGRTIGEQLGRKERKRRLITIDTVVGLVIGYRVAHVGKEAYVGATVIPAKGVFQGGEERTLRFEIRWFTRGSARESTYGMFRDNVTRMAQQLCSDLAQAEIHIVFTRAGSEDVVITSPFGLPTGLDRKAAAALAAKRRRKR